MAERPITWISPIEMESVTVQLFENGDPAGQFPAGSGTGNTIQVSCPNENSDYTAGWFGTTTLQPATVGEPGGGSGSGEGGGG